MQVQQMGHVLPQRQSPVSNKMDGLLKVTSDVRANPLQKSIRGEKAVPETRLDMTCLPIKSGTSLSTSWQDKNIGTNALNGPVCGRERPDSHTFKV